MAKNWWEQRTLPKLDRTQKNMLPDVIPTPEDPGPHRLPLLPGVQGGDDWRLINAINQHGGPQVVVQLSCCSCDVKHRAIAFRALFDPTVKWLCDDCLDSGYAWGSTIPNDQMKHYQMVKSFKDDTLVRKLSKSVNPHDPEHRPVDAAERTQKLERKKLRLEDL